MTFDSLLPIVLTILFLSTLTRSTLGFGDALVSMPLLGLILEDVKTAAALTAMVSTTTSVGILAKHWQSVDIRAVSMLVLGAYAGVPLGVYLLIEIDPSPVKAVLALVIISFCIYRIIQPRGLALNSDRAACLFGFSAGVLGGAFNTHGPSLVIYGALRNWSAERFRATLQGYFLFVCPIVLGFHYQKGLWTRQVVVYYLASLPIIFLSLYLGNKLHRRLHGRNFTSVVHWLLIVVGIALLAQVIWKN